MFTKYMWFNYPSMCIFSKTPLNAQQYLQRVQINLCLSYRNHQSCRMETLLRRYIRQIKFTKNHHKQITIEFY